MTIKGAISFKDTPLAPKNEAWDGGAEVKAATVDDLKIMCAWVDPDNADIKTGYKLPHHKAGGDHAVVWRGVANAMARLNQTQMPDGDRRSVYNHLSKHYAQFNETPPDFKSFEDDMTERGMYATYDAKTKLAVASTSVIDRQGESIDQGGWDLKNYQANPVILWAHDHTIPAIGSAPDMRISRAGGEKRLVFTPQFNEATDFAKAIKFLYEGDENTAPTLNSFSVGFLPKEFDPETSTYTDQELLEVSAVNVPANPEAHMLAYKALKQKGFKTETIEELGISTKVLDRIATLEKTVGDLESLVKDKIPSAPKAKVLNKRQMMAKAISRASDLLLEDNKHKTLSTDNRKTLVKVIKRASEKISASQKEQING